MKIPNTRKSNSSFGAVKLENGKSCSACCMPIRKYSLEENQWNEVSKENTGKAFSVVKYSTEYGKLANNPNYYFEYFILLVDIRKEIYYITGTSIDSTSS